jgi:hypothetical protein
MKKPFLCSVCDAVLGVEALGNALIGKTKALPVICQNCKEGERRDEPWPHQSPTKVT